MGYETELIFVTGNNKTKAGRICGYQSVEATLEMGKCAYGVFGELIDRCRNEVKATHDQAVRDVEHMELLGRELFTHEGNYTPEMEAIKTQAEREKRSAPYYKEKRAIETKLPYFYKDGNTELFLDAYGDLLLVASLIDLKLAILKSNAEEIHDKHYENGGGYRRFNMAIRLIEAFQLDFGEDVQVILYGH